MSRLTLILSIPILTALAGACGSPPGGGPCTGNQIIEGCGQQCSNDVECPTGLHCGNSTCTAECTFGGTECSSDETCDGRGHCVPVTSRPDAGPRTDANCPDKTVNAKGRIPAVQLLIDQSSSMTTELESPTGMPCDDDTSGKPSEGDLDDCPQRWVAMIDALVNPTNGVITTLRDRVIFGASLYTGIKARKGPPPTPAVCPRLISEPRALNNDKIQTLLANNGPAKDTPTGASIDQIVKDFMENPPPPNSTPIILLATDGLPDTCTDPDPQDAPAQENANQETVKAAQRAYAAGFPVVILSVGNEIGDVHLQEMANAGAGKDPKTGTEKFYKANKPAELSAALAEIVGDVRSCTFDLDAKVSPRHADSGVVKLDGKELVFNTDWKLLEDNKTIELVGATCQTFLDRGGDIDASFPCGAVID